MYHLEEPLLSNEIAGLLVRIALVLTQSSWHYYAEFYIIIVIITLFRRHENIGLNVVIRHADSVILNTF